jgi:Flp pilus assembly protein TadD
LADKAVNNALRLGSNLPEVHLTYANHLYRGYRDYEQARVQVAIAKRGLPNSADAMVLQAWLDRRQGKFEKAIEELNQALKLDPRNPEVLSALAGILADVRQFPTAEEAYSRLLQLTPENALLKVEKEFDCNYLKTGNCTAVLSAIAVLPAAMSDNRRILTLRLNFLLANQDLAEANRLVEQMKGGEAAFFGYAGTTMPIACYSLLLARLLGASIDANSSFTETREILSRKVAATPENASLLSGLALVDALLARKQDAINEAKTAVERLRISDDAVEGPNVAANLATVYAWTGELDLALQQLTPLTTMPCGVYYGQLKNYWPWTPLRQDPRFKELLNELAPPD